jgi:hypothetical protein
MDEEVLVTLNYDFCLFKFRDIDWSSTPLETPVGHKHDITDS